MSAFIQHIIHQILSDYGIALLFAAGMILWIKRDTKENMIIWRDRENRLLDIIEGYEQSLKEHTTMLQEFYATIKNANEFQRKEHELLMAKLDNVCNMIIDSKVHNGKI